jgi:ABC-type nitrate/sulfonate/bicarbonate transport system permease component
MDTQTILMIITGLAIGFSLGTSIAFWIFYEKFKKRLG